MIMIVLILLALVAATFIYAHKKHETALELLKGEVASLKVWLRELQHKNTLPPT